MTLLGKQPVSGANLRSGAAAVEAERRAVIVLLIGIFGTRRQHGSLKLSATICEPRCGRKKGVELFDSHTIEAALSRRACIQQSF